MKKSIKSLLSLVAVTCFFFGFVQETQAISIILTDMASQTTAGQNFNFNFNGLAGSDGTGGTFSIRARGDYYQYSIANPVEFLNWDIDGFASASIVGAFSSPNPGGYGGPFDYVNHFSGNDLEFQRSYALSGSVVNQILSDGMMNIFVDLVNDVDVISANSAVEVTFTYNDAAPVPEPATVTLLGLGLIGVAIYGRRRHQNS